MGLHNPPAYKVWLVTTTCFRRTAKGKLYLVYKYRILFWETILQRGFEHNMYKLQVADVTH